MRDLRQWISLLRREKEIVDIFEEVDPHLELAEVHRRVIAQEGPALFFHNVKGSGFPVVTNLFGTKRRVDLAFQNRPQEHLEQLVHTITNEEPSLRLLWKLRSLGRLGLRKAKNAPVLEHEIHDLNQLPLITSWPEDGGAFFTLPLVYTEPLGGGPGNLGIYRMQRFSAREAGLHWQIAKGGGFHFAKAEALNQNLPVTVMLGGPPALMMSAIAPLPENVPELLFASFLMGEKLSLCKKNEHSFASSCEFVLCGEAHAHERRLEGPFGDHYGYYSLAHEFPVFHCKAIYHRKDAIYPATIVGKPYQEDYFIGNYLQELLAPLFPVVMPGVKALWSYGESGFHALTAAVVQERYARECMSSAFRILGEGQLSLSKFLLLTDQNINLKDFKMTLQAVLERFQPERDLFIFSNLCLDTLDYTGPTLNHGSRGVLVGIGDKIRTLPNHFFGTLPHGIRKVAPYCPGVLVLEGEFCEPNHLDFASWPLLILVDDLESCLKSFLWTVFTRFEPAADITSRRPFIYRNHLCHTLPILIDARMKPSYPATVECDEQTQELVNLKWKKYFL